VSCLDIDGLDMITLMTDFGTTDTYVGIMKGVISGIASHVPVVDLTHAVSPQNVLEGSARWETVCDYFPAGTVHVGVVDPGVGSKRSIVLVQTERAFWLAPDNGLLTMILNQELVHRVVRLTEKATPYCLPQVSATFHGRDVFAPIAAHLAMGLTPEALGDEISIESLVRLPETEAVWTQNAHEMHVAMRVLFADRFGNLILNLRHEDWQARAGKQTHLAVQAVSTEDDKLPLREISRTFADVAVGEPLLYWGSGSRLELALRDDSAAHRFRLAAGSPLTLVCHRH
jgi:S-adenosyl-L-methionine hydrolase (adenosine-forming)